MFALSDEELTRRIVGCADGPASFNAEATRRGGRVVSCDPLYRWDAAQVADRIAATSDQVLEQTRRNASDFVWSSIPSVEELGRLRMGAMREFLKDYEQGRRAGRYVEAALPALPFQDRVFDLALCSHFLFLYTSHLDEAFHVAAICEMCRVAAEVRIFPVLALDGRRSAYVEPVVTRLRGWGFEVSIERVPYEFQRGGNEMMRVGIGDQ
jgi:hypothetical protein